MGSMQSVDHGPRQRSHLLAVLCILAGTAAGLNESLFGQGPNRSAQKFGPDTSSSAEKRLRNAEGLARDRQWSEAINIYQRVIDEFGDKVVLLPRAEGDAAGSSDFLLYVDQRRYCHAAIAHLPAEARAIYRTRMDSLAERWFQEGARLRDRGLLRRVVDQAFCSSWGDDALELLGDLSFQDGQFGDSLAMYGRLVADSTDVLVHPDPSVDLPRVAAKKLLCRAAQGENPPTREAIDDFAKRYPGAEGSLAGRKGNYATIVTEALRGDRLAPGSQADSRWPTFAGALSRSKVAPGPIDVGSTQWRVELEKVWPNRTTVFGTRGGGIGATAGASASERLLAFHPIVLGDQVIVSDGVRVLAYNLNDRPAESDGSMPRPVEPAWKYDPENGTQMPQARAMQMVIPRYTLTTVDHRIYARMGGMNAAFVPGMGNVGGRGTSSIIALDWNTQGKLLWECKSSSITLPNQPAERHGSSKTVSFEGTPVADAHHVYVAVTDRREQTATYIACFDADTGASRWIRYLGTASPDVNVLFGMMPMQFGVGGGSDFNHRLLSLEGSAIYYQTDLGAVVALEAETGATRWVATYPRQEPNQGA